MSLNLLLASTSTVHGHPYLSYYKEASTAHFAKGSGPVLFVPLRTPGRHELGRLHRPCHTGL